MSSNNKKHRSVQITSNEEEPIELISTKPGRTRDGKPFDRHEQRMVAEGKWTLELVPAEALGLSRPLEVYRASRSGRFVVPWKREDGESYCPAYWADIKIGFGACGLRCRGCFLVTTLRVKANPARHVVHSNTEDCVRDVRRWLRKPNRRTLGLGIDCSDSLLYEGATGLARSILSLVASPSTNPSGVKLVLLTKSTNVHYLEGLPTDNVVATFSLNPESIADLWEGKFDDGVRVTPPIGDRVAASVRSQDMGFEVRWRVDPILTPEGWEDQYAEFFNDAARDGARPTRVTLGTYRETSRSLHTFVKNWGLPAMEWVPTGLVKEGMHWHVPTAERIQVYRRITGLVQSAWQGTGHMPTVALCKEPVTVRSAAGLDHTKCNCAP